MPKPTELNQEYLLQRITKVNGCWEWNLSTNPDGYGHIKNKGKMFYAHRISYKLFVGDPVGKLVCHHCDNPKCVNPEHLFLGDFVENYMDMIAKGRGKGYTPQWNNNYRGKCVKIGETVFSSYKEAGRALGISDNGVRKRIRLGWYKGYDDVAQK